MPVLPAVPSTTVPPGFNVPHRSASSTIHFAARSLTEPPGFMNSTLPRISQPVSLLKACRRISGVLPIAPMKPSFNAISRIPFGSATGASRFLAGGQKAGYRIRHPGSERQASVSISRNIRHSIVRCNELEHVVHVGEKKEGGRRVGLLE